MNKTIEDFLTVHRSDAYATILIEWFGPDCKGSFNSKIKKDFFFELDETQQQLISDWISKKAHGANRWSYSLNII